MARKRNVFDVLEELSNMNDSAVPQKKNVLIRVDFNVPITDEGKIADDSRIRGALPTINAVLGAKCNAILGSHLGRPKLVQKGGDDEETKQQRIDLSLKRVAEYLGNLLEQKVLFGDDCMNADDAISQLPKDGGGILLLENLRFYKGEEKKEDKFTAKLASYADAYINDAFGTCHRAHGSVSGVPGLLPTKLCGIGQLVDSELSYLDFKTVDAEDHIAAIIGGSKVSTKLPVIKGLLGQVKTLVLGGGLAFTFMRAQGIPIGDSLVEEGMVKEAQDLLELAKSLGKNFVLPVDVVCSQTFPKSAMSLDDTKTFNLVPGEGIQDGWMGLDAGPKSVQVFHDALQSATKIVLNGPMGVFEVQPFDAGTIGLLKCLEEFTKNGCISVVGGGDSVSALEQFGMTKSVSYVSTGGGATLELLAGDVLPGVEAISNVE